MRAIERIVVALYIQERLFKMGSHNGPTTVVDWALSTKELVHEVGASNGTVLQKAHDLCNGYKPRGVVVRKIDKPRPGYRWALTEEFYNRVGPAADAVLEILAASRGASVSERYLMDELEKRGQLFRYDTFCAVAIELVSRPEHLVSWDVREERFALDVDRWLKAAAADQRRNNGK